MLAGGSDAKQPNRPDVDRDRVGRRLPPGDRPLVILAGGGSGGHVFPGIAVAERLFDQGCDVEWIGRGDGLEQGWVEKAGLVFHPVAAAPVRGRSRWTQLRSLLLLVRSAVGVKALLRRRRARLLLGTGGFASAPAVLGAHFAGCPRALLEPNLSAGLANRFLSRWAERAFTASARTATELRCPTQEVGIPLRKAMTEGLDPRRFAPTPHLLVLGGSQGARQVNRLVPRALGRIHRWPSGFEVLHQTGADHLAETELAYRRQDLPVRWRTVGFVDDVRTALAQAHLVVSRAGAITLAELTAAGRPSILVPLRLAAAHQVENAERLAAAGAARIVLPAAEEPTEVECEELARAIEELFDTAGARAAVGEPPVELSAALAEMSAASRDLARPAAAIEVAGWIARRLGVSEHVQRGDG